MGQSQRIRIRTEAFAKIIQCSKEAFANFLQRLISVVKRIITDQEVRQMLIESLAFENNSECKKVIKFGSIFPCHHWRNSSTLQLKDIMTIVKNHTALDVSKDRTISIDTTEGSGDIRKQIFWQIAINDQRPKLKIH